MTDEDETKRMEFLVHMKVGSLQTASETEEALRAKEATRARELALAGTLVRLWRVPGRRENWGIWIAENTDQLHNALSSLPLFPYMEITVHPLASHPNDPEPQRAELGSAAPHAG